jgi:phosphoenolpyruvate carboxykinase (GTP)
MKPFCAYNMGDYFRHWLSMGERLGSKAPRIFYVNWFRKNDEGRFLWPGFSENSRVLKWMCERIDNKVGARKSPIGLLPLEDDLDLSGLAVSPADMKELMSVRPAEWKAEIPDIEAHFSTFGNRLPEELRIQLREFRERLG